MAKNYDRYEQIKRFENDLGQCMKCGFCTFWCPVYQEEHIEASVARGKNMMIRGLLAGELDYTKEYADRLNKCTLCMACTTNCPAKANIPNVIVAARADTVKARGLKFPQNIVYRWLLPRRRLFGWAVRFASWFQGIFMPKTEGTIRHLSMFLSALGKGRNISQIAPKFLRQIVPVVPREQGCCGAPVFLGAGDFETGRKMADSNVKAFEGLDYVISDCATCTSALKDYAKFLADTPKRKKTYEKFAKKVKDISEFLVDVLDLPASAYKASAEAKGKKVTWHDPCHLSRHLGITSQPRQLIKSIPGVDYVEMPNADRCCGMAGAFSLNYYDLSKDIADKKAASVEASGADIVVTSCPGCEIQLIDSLVRNKLPVKVMHIMELIE